MLSGLYVEWKYVELNGIVGIVFMKVALFWMVLSLAFWRKIDAYKVLLSACCLTPYDTARIFHGTKVV